MECTASKVQRTWNVTFTRITSHMGDVSPLPSPVQQDSPMLVSNRSTVSNKIKKNMSSLPFPLRVSIHSRLSIPAVGSRTSQPDWRSRSRPPLAFSALGDWEARSPAASEGATATGLGAQAIRRERPMLFSSCSGTGLPSMASEGPAGYAELEMESDFDALLSPDGYIYICGFGSLLSERSARSTFPELRNFRVALLRGFRRVFCHAAPVFFERGIAKQETGEISSLSVEPCDGETLVVTTFEIKRAEIPSFIEREHEFRFLAVVPEQLDGSPYTHPAVLCARYSDDEYFRVRCKGSKEIYFQRYGRYNIHKIWRNDIFPCRAYLRHWIQNYRCFALLHTVRMKSSTWHKHQSLSLQLASHMGWGFLVTKKKIVHLGKKSDGLFRRPSKRSIVVVHWNSLLWNNCTFECISTVPVVVCWTSVQA